jgi:fluoride exporter
VREIVLVAVGGALGAVLRYTIGLAITARATPGFPWNTLAVNVVGAFLIGLLMALPLGDGVSGAAWRLFLATGILGGFTTFSALSYESIALIENGALWAGLANMFGSGAVGLAAAWLGLVAGRAL